MQFARAADNMGDAGQRGSACGPVIVPVFKTGGRRVTPSPVGSTPTRFRHCVVLTQKAGVSVNARELTTTTARFEVVIRNIGDASTKLFTFKVATNVPEVSLSTDVSFSKINIPSDLTGNEIIIPIENLISGEWAALTLTGTYPESVKGFDVTLAASGENVAPETLGSIHVTPPEK